MEVLRNSAGHRSARIIVFLSKRVLKRKKTNKQLECNRQSVQSFISSTPYHVVFGFLIPLLTEVMDANFQCAAKSMFETHPANMWVFLLAIFIYSFAFAADKKFHLYHTAYSQLFTAVVVISGSLSSVSLISIFLPFSHGHIIFIAWTLVPVIVVYQHATSIKNACNWIQEKVKKTAISMLSDFRRNESTEQQQVRV